MWIGLFFFVAVLAAAYLIGAANGGRDSQSYTDDHRARDRREGGSFGAPVNPLHDEWPGLGMEEWVSWGCDKGD